jgi:hypothetical protein
MKCNLNSNILSANNNHNLYLPIVVISLRLKNNCKKLVENQKNNKKCFPPMIVLSFWRNRLLFLGNKLLRYMISWRKSLRNWKFINLNISIQLK